MAIFNNKITTVVEISDKHIKIAQVSFAGKEIKVIACVYKELAATSAETTETELKKILREYNIKPKDLILVIPRQLVTTKNIRLPSQNSREIGEMAGFQALKQIPYPKEEIAYGFSVYGADAEGYSKVILVICHRDAIIKPIEILKRCGLVPQKVTLSSFGLLNWFIVSGDYAKRSEASPVILVDCNAASSDIAIIYKSKLIYTRGLSFGYGEGDKYRARLREEIEKTLSVYEAEPEAGRPVEAIFTGKVTELADSKEYLEDALNMKVEFIDSFRPVPLDILPKFQSCAAQTSYSALIGSAFQLEEADLLPKEMKTALALKAKKKEVITSVILAATLILLISFIIWNKILQKERNLKALESKLTQTAPAAEKIEKMRSASDVIKFQLKKKSEALDVLNEIYRIVPPQIYLALYTYEEDRVDLKGTATVLSDVFKFVTILENSPYFQNVEVRYATKRKIGDQELVDFEITCPLSAKQAEKR